MEKIYTKDGYSYKDFGGRVITRSRESLVTLLAKNNNMLEFAQAQIDTINSDIEKIDALA